MKPIFLWSSIVIASLSAIPAFGDSNRTALAREIEELSLTTNQALFDTGDGVGWTLYPPIIRRRFLTINNCLVTNQVVRITAENQEDILFKIEFDLSLALLPDASSVNGEAFAYLHPTAIFDINFRPPYQPVFQDDPNGKNLQNHVTVVRVLMEPIEDDRQPRQLLSALKRYQQEYCVFGS